MAEEQPSPPPDSLAPVPAPENTAVPESPAPADAGAAGSDPLADLLAAAKEVSPDAGAPGEDAEALDQASIDELLKQANFEDPSAEGTVVAPDAAGFKLPNFPTAAGDGNAANIELLRDVELNVKIELGRARMLVEDVLKLAEGSVVELDKLAGDPVDVFVNDRLVARGEVLVLNDNFCVRVNEIMAGVKEEGT
ncbi:MAG TPA: flagellar motor switch protein FliN [Tepidisphaeraceae bacterium]|jgi:flagellar motor switch protein FliN/FliY|nr:flagellar motor switch protein FliN [Tepidisphaeraceae bacterium]